MRLKKHDWYCVGGGGGWEVWACHDCGIDAIPSIFGTLWPDLLKYFFKSYRCVNGTDGSPEGSYTQTWHR